ncbi:hypothetical protein APHAL10511_000839 [Amanita phalloides]|nr:hypothetical protein APHAL10511_000839 [Amanita phalloides]
MLSKSTLPIFTAVAFALSTLAHSHPQRRDGPITIPDFHNNSIEDNGMIINDLAWSLVDAGTLQRRTNGPAAIVPLSKKGHVYTAPITVGTPRPDANPQSPSAKAQMFHVIIDTGKRTSWLASSLGASPTPPHTYNPEWSFTSKNLNKEFSAYGDVKGEWFWDVFDVGGIKTEKVRFGCAKERGMYKSEFDGVIGIADSTSPEHVDQSFFSSVLQQHSKVNSFAFYFGKERSEFQLGLTKESIASMRCYPMITVTQASDMAGLTTANIFVDKRPLFREILPHGTEAIFNSGSPQVSGPPGQVLKLYRRLGGREWRDTFIIPCNNKRVVSFLFSGDNTRWEISGSLIEDPNDEVKPGMCRGAIRANRNVHGNLWILGLDFMSGRHIGYDFGIHKICMADAP